MSEVLAPYSLGREDVGVEKERWVHTGLGLEDRLGRAIEGEREAQGRPTGIRLKQMGA